MEQKIDDLILIPYLWLPPKILQLLSTSRKKGKEPSHEFYSDDLGAEGNFYYIDNMGRLIFRDICMTVLVDKSVTGVNSPTLITDTEHKLIFEPELEKVYSHIKDKFCILELDFKDGILKQVNSIIE